MRKSKVLTQTPTCTTDVILQKLVCLLRMTEMKTLSARERDSENSQLERQAGQRETMTVTESKLR